MPTTGTCCRQTRLGAFTDQIALKLGKRAKAVEDQLACTGGSVDVLPQTLEANPTLGKCGDGLDEVLQGMAVPI
jgi:hypothetical protein